MPLSYGEFRKLVAGAGGGEPGRAAAGRGAAVRKPLAAPESIKGFPAGRWVCSGFVLFTWGG